jgi:hypothetical protein
MGTDILYILYRCYIENLTRRKLKKHNEYTNNRWRYYLTTSRTSKNKLIDLV